jgi:hypothetical protein
MTVTETRSRKRLTERERKLMATRVYDIAKKLGIESKVVLAKAKKLGIILAKVPSSSLDKITAQYLEEQLGGGKNLADVKTPPTPEPLVIVSSPPELPPPITLAETRLEPDLVEAKAMALPPLEPPLPPKPPIGEKVGFIHMPQKPTPKIGPRPGPAQLPPKHQPVTTKPVVPLVTHEIITTKPPASPQPTHFSRRNELFLREAEQLVKENVELENRNERLFSEIARLRRGNMQLSKTIEDLDRRLAKAERYPAKFSSPAESQASATKRVPSQDEAVNAQIVVVDGTNVMNYTANPKRRSINLATLLTVLVCLKRKSIDFNCFFDANTYYILKDFQPKQLEIFERLQQKYPDRFSVITGGAAADSFILSQADALNCLILSNDKFVDYAEEFPRLLSTPSVPQNGNRKPCHGDCWLVKGNLIGNRVLVPQFQINEIISPDLTQLLAELDRLMVDKVV